MPRIAHLTEAGILSRILPILADPAPDSDASLEVGPGDDAAVLRLRSPRLVISTDTLSEGEDFLPGTTTPTAIGHKVAVQNLADIAAMGARPRGILVALSAPGSTPAAVLEGISHGLASVCARYGVAVLGGDLGGAQRLTITATAVGDLAETDRPVLRGGARAGDVLAVASPGLGRSGAGLAAIGAGAAENLGDLVAWHNAPDPDLAVGWRVAPAAATAMIDVSDGLVRDAGRLAAAGELVVDLDRTALEADVRQLAAAGEQLQLDPWSWVLHGGEEHALLATFPPDAVPEPFRPIGNMSTPQEGAAAGTVRLDGDPVVTEGWDHFA